MSNEPIGELHPPTPRTGENEEEQSIVDLDESPSDYVAHRIFLNHVDTYHGRQISAFITDQKFIKKSEDEEEEDEERSGKGDDDDEGKKVDESKAPNFEVVGTLFAEYNKKSEDILYLVDENDEESFIKEIMKCGFIVYDITRDPGEIKKAIKTLDAIQVELEKIKDIGPKTFKKFTEMKTFILLSTVMTWGRTKSLDPDDPEFSFSEEDYKKRKPHPNYKEHIDCEKELIKRRKLYKDKLKIIVVCSGITYGEQEEDLDFFFKQAWYNEKYLPIFGTGNNWVPLINIKDLAKILYLLMINTEKTPPIVLAIENTPSKLKKIIKTISKWLGQNKTKNVDVSESFLHKNLQQTTFERCTVNLRMSPNFAEETLEMEWINEGALPEFMKKIVEEFKKSRNLAPFKIILLGPPASGKTTLAKKLVIDYGLTHVEIDALIKNTITELEENIKIAEEKAKAKEAKENEATENGEEAEEEEEGEDEEPSAEDLQEKLTALLTVMADNSEKLPDDFVVNILKSYLAKNICQNQGYVLEGYPETVDQAKLLFGEGAGGEEEEAGEEEEDEGASVAKIKPDYVICLQADDNFLCKRVMQLPQTEIEGSLHDEANMLRRLNEYRENNPDDRTVLDFFDENEMHPILINIMESDLSVEKIFARITKILGAPKGFGLSHEEILELARIEKEQKLLAEEKARIEREMEKERLLQERTQKMEEWTKTLEKLQMEEEKLLEAESVPLRHYLVKYVFPILTEGLMKVAKIKPNDPVDYLAEFLFQQNPEGKMFDPSYNMSGEKLLEECKLTLEPFTSGEAGDA